MSLTLRRFHAFAERTCHVFPCIALQHKCVTLPRLISLEDPAQAQRRCMATGVNTSESGSRQGLLGLRACAPLSTPTSSSLKICGPESTQQRTLPTTCPGCGAFTQGVYSQEAGYYSNTRKAVKRYLRCQTPSMPKGTIQKLPEIPCQASQSHQQQQHRTEQDSCLVMEAEAEVDDAAIHSLSKDAELPVCDRCHELTYNNKGQSISHPTLEDIVESIAESPYDRNHLYHVLDAADFPMSLIPGIYDTMRIARPRSQNRRARTKFSDKPTLSFIITRSDLLGPNKQMVDKMMPYFQSLLRSALGRQARDVRMGNVHLVSAKRGWWTKELKDSIWERGGGNWMVGKVNVGKSNLFPVLFPKGSGDRALDCSELHSQQPEADIHLRHELEPQKYLQQNSLLPPAQHETKFPTMPVVSHLPGTTASPIRIPFGNRRGELVDMPGLDRGSLEQFIHPHHKSDLVMQYRPNVKQYVIKPGQSLLLGGGLIRITPHLELTDSSTTMLAYPFIPIDAHVTATDKAIATQLQKRESGVKSILANDITFSIKSNGVYQLETDVTKAQAGPVIRAGIPASVLPFRIYSSDILIEGMGWVELVCQVRRPKNAIEPGSATLAKLPYSEAGIDESHNTASEIGHVADTTPMHTYHFEPYSNQGSSLKSNSSTVDNIKSSLPRVEIFSPNGEHIGIRKPLGAWMLWKASSEQRQRAKLSARPRRSMKGAKKKTKHAQ